MMKTDLVHYFSVFGVIDLALTFNFDHSFCLCFLVVEVDAGNCYHGTSRHTPYTWGNGRHLSIRLEQTDLVVRVNMQDIAISEGPEIIIIRG